LNDMQADGLLKGEAEMFTTAMSVHTSSDIPFYSARCISPGRLWAFTDGSSKGGYGAVVIDPYKTISCYSGYARPSQIANVGAELDGVLLALSVLPKACTGVLVSDYVGLGQWLTKRCSTNSELVKDRLRLAMILLERRSLRLDYIQHKGHQRDGSHFSTLNGMADKLCSLRSRTEKHHKWEDVFPGDPNAEWLQDRPADA